MFSRSFQQKENGWTGYIEIRNPRKEVDEERAAGMVRIVLHKFGDVEEIFVNEVLEIINDCYNRIDSHAVEIVDLYFFDRSSKMNAFIGEEKRKMGIETSPFEESFFAVHDAWYGIPRIMVAYDRALELPRLVRAGCIRHEAAHTILHGSLEYYSFPMPISLYEMERKGIILKQVAIDLLYLASMAVKDYEVTRLLYQKGFAEEQFAYNKYFLEPSQEDQEVWEIAKNDRNARLIVLVSLLKTCCCAAPLLKDEKFGGDMEKLLTHSMNHLPVELVASILRLLKATDRFGKNTHENVDLLMKAIIDEICPPNSK
jgi:hypothetical protein